MFLFLFYFHAINHNVTKLTILIFLNEILYLKKKTENLDDSLDNKRRHDHDERRDFLREIGLDRYEAYYLAKEKSFDVQYYREKRREWFKSGLDHTQVDKRLLAELKSDNFKYVKDIDKDHGHISYIRKVGRDYELKTNFPSDSPDYGGFRLDFNYDLPEPKMQHDIKERIEFLREIGLTRNEAYDLSKEINFDVQYYGKKRKELVENGNRNTQVNARLLAELQSGNYKYDNAIDRVYGYMPDIQDTVATNIQSERDYPDCGGFKLDYKYEPPRTLRKNEYNNDNYHYAHNNSSSPFRDEHKMQCLQNSRSPSAARRLNYMDEKEYNTKKIHQQPKREHSPTINFECYNDSRHHSPNNLSPSRSSFREEPLREYIESSILHSAARNLNNMEDRNHNARESHYQCKSLQSQFKSEHNYQFYPDERNQLNIKNFRSISRSPSRNLNYLIDERELRQYMRSSFSPKRENRESRSSSPPNVERNIHNFQLSPSSFARQKFDYNEERQISQKTHMYPSPNKIGSDTNCSNGSINDFQTSQGNFITNISTEDQYLHQYPLVDNQHCSQTKNVSVYQKSPQLLQQPTESAIKKKTIKPVKNPANKKNRIDIYKKSLAYFKVINSGFYNPAPGHLKAKPQEYWTQWWSVYNIENAVPKVDSHDAEILSRISFLHKPDEPEFYKRKQLLLKLCHKMDHGFRFNEKDYPYCHSFKLLILKKQLEDARFQNILSPSELQHVQINLQSLAHKPKLAFLHQSLICRWYSAMDVVKRVSKGELIKIKKSLRLLKQNLYHYMVTESIRELKKLCQEDWPEFYLFYKNLKSKKFCSYDINLVYGVQNAVGENSSASEDDQ